MLALPSAALILILCSFRAKACHMFYGTARRRVRKAPPATATRKALLPKPRASPSSTKHRGHATLYTHNNTHYSSSKLSSSSWSLYTNPTAAKPPFSPGCCMRADCMSFCWMRFAVPCRACGRVYVCVRVCVRVCVCVHVRVCVCACVCMCSVERKQVPDI